MPTNDNTLREIASTLPGAVTLFNRHGIHFCCGRDRTLQDVAQTDALDLDTLRRELALLPRFPSDAPRETVALVGFICDRFHKAHWGDMPILVGLARRIESEHRDHRRVPVGLAHLLSGIFCTLAAHMRYEEDVLFPLLRSAAAKPPRGSLQTLRRAHDELLQAIRPLQALTHGFKVPKDACHTWAALYAGLEALTNELLQHIHLENDLLFPRLEAEGCVP